MKNPNVWGRGDADYHAGFTLHAMPRHHGHGIKSTAVKMVANAAWDA